jgi:peptide/nickel transport system permease protein
MRGVPVIVLLAMLVLAALVGLAAFGDWLTPHDWAASNLRARLRPPVFMGGTWDYPLGTDRLGRDGLARLVVGLRVSFAVALLGTLIGALIGTALGFLAAHARGWVEDGLMAAVDFQASMPFIIIALCLLAFFGNSLTLFVLLMGLNGWEVYARLVRGVVLSARAQPYAQAVVALGAGPPRLYLRHVLPNIAGVLIVQFTLNFPGTILLETALSFLGLGIQPPLTSLGVMLGEGRDYLINAPWLSVVPGTAIFLATLSLSLIGDWLRDRLDPTLVSRRG